MEAVYDVNGDGVLNIRDYDHAEWLADRRGRAVEVPIFYVWREHGVSKARILPLALGYLRTAAAFLGRR